MNPHEYLKDIREEYDIQGGIIRNPGKFEGEAEWVPYYWELAMDCEGEELTDYDDTGEIVGDFVSRFRVDSEEADAFGLECGARIEIRQDSQGYIIGTVLA